MKQVFFCVLSLSLSGALTGLLILLIRPVTRKLLSKSWHYYIWLLVAARLMLPVYFETDFARALASDMGWKQEEEMEEGRTEAAWDVQQAEAEQDASRAEAVQEQVFAVSDLKAGPVQEQKQMWEQGTLPVVDWGLAAGMTWFLGMLASFFIKIKNYRQFTSYVRKEWELIADPFVHDAAGNICAKLSMGRRPRIYESKAVSGPVTIGLQQPVIVLPKGERDLTQLPLVLHHELLHVKRRDLWYKWLYQILLCVHWFNPVLYLIGRKLNIDCELSCDEGVLESLTREGKKAYGNILLDAARGNMNYKKNIPSVTLLERKGDLKERLNGILQYKNKTVLKTMVSLYLFMGLVLLSACGSVQVSQDAVPIHVSGDAWEEPSFWDRAAAWMDSGLDTFLAQSVPDKDEETWKVYDDDLLIGGEDIRSQWSMFFYRGGKSIKCSGMFLNGAATVMIANAPEDMDIQVKSAFHVLDGRFKLVHINPEGEVTVINDTGEEGSFGITMGKGRNVIKLVGQGAELRDLTVGYAHLKEKDFESIYYSEDAEQGDIVKAEIEAGAVDKDAVMEYLVYLDDKTVSQALAVLLKQGETLDADDLYQLMIYSDSKLSGRYLVEAVKNGETEPPSEMAVSKIKYYLREEELAQLLAAMDEDLTFDLLCDCAPYLSSSGVEECVKKYMDLGNELTDSQIKKIAPYL